MSPLINVAFDWACRAFGREHVYNRPIRALRCAEEVVELCQAHQIDRETMLRLVEVVYSRPPGDSTAEIGGVLMTINVLCAARGIDPDKAFEEELLRVLAKPIEHYTRRNQEKVDLGLTA